MKKTERLKKFLPGQQVVNGQQTRFYLEHVESSAFTGMTVFVEDEYLVLANMGRKVLIESEVVKEVAEDGHVLISARDEDGPVEYSFYLDINGADN